MAGPPPNNALDLSVRPVTSVAHATAAPCRPTAYGRRWADKGMHMHSRWMRLIALALLVIPLTRELAAEPSSWGRYVPQTLQTVIDLHAESVTGSDFTFSARDFPSKATVVYTGQQRMLPKRCATFLDMYFKTRQLSSMRDLYESEILIREGTREHWLPIQKVLVSPLVQEVRPGQRVTIYATWLGVYKEGEIYNWVFAVNEFDAPGAQ